MEFEVDSEGELRCHECHDDVRKRFVGRLEEFPTTMRVSEEVPSDCQRDASAL